jgi:hypothetical protein
MTAPKTMKILQQMAAVRNRTILLPTAVPKTLEASLAPRDQPKNKPLDRKKRNIIRLNMNV